MEPDYADFRLKVGDKQVHVSKAFLQVRSEEFKRQIAGKLETKELHIEGSTYNAVYATIYWLFNLTLPGDCSNDDLLDIWAFADKYKLNELKEACEERMIKSIEDKTVLHLIPKADNVKCSRVKDECLKFIAPRPHILKDRDGMQGLSKDLILNILQEAKLWPFIRLLIPGHWNVHLELELRWSYSGLALHHTTGTEFASK